MRHVFLILFFVAARLFGQEPVVTELLLFQDGVRITENVTVECDPGPNRVSISGLPGRLDTATLRVAIEESEAVLSAVVPEARTARDDPQLQALEAEIAFHEARVQTLSQERELREQRLGIYMEFISRFGRAGDVSPDHALASLESLIDESEPARRAIVEEMHAIETRMRNHEAAAERVRQDRKTRLAELKVAAMTLNVELRAPAPGPVRLRVQYFSPKASWTPHYTYRLHPESLRADASFDAQIQQETSRIWPAKTPLILTNASFLSPEPDARPWRLNLLLPETVKPFAQTVLPVVSAHASNARLLTLLDPTRSPTGVVALELAVPFVQDLGAGNASVYADGAFIGQQGNLPTTPNASIVLPLHDAPDVTALHDSGHWILRNESDHAQPVRFIAGDGTARELSVEARATVSVNPPGAGSR